MLFRSVANQVASAIKLQEQQSLREQLFRGEKLAATGTMISGIAGELRSPVETISKLSTDLMETLKRRDDIPAVEAGLAKVVTEKAHPGWPEGYLEAVCGSCPDFHVPEDPPDPPVEPWDRARS